MTEGMRLRRVSNDDYVKRNFKGELQYAILEPCDHRDSEGRETWVTPVLPIDDRIPSRARFGACEPSAVFCRQCGLRADETQESAEHKP